jgi:hypothetical protein
VLAPAWKPDRYSMRLITSARPSRYEAGETDHGTLNLTAKLLSPAHSGLAIANFSKRMHRRMASVKMQRHHLRRRFSLALPALVFLSLAVLETVEVETVAETLAALGTEDVQSKPVVPAGHIEKVLHCPKTACPDCKPARDV